MLRLVILISRFSSDTSFPSSSGGIEKEIDEYQDESPGSDGSYKSSSESNTSSRDNSSQDEYYSSGVPGFPLKEFQEMERRTASGAEASSFGRSRSPSPPQDKEEDKNVIYSCTPEVASTLDANRLTTLVGRYQIPSEFRPRLLERGEWCCSTLLGFSVYTSYLLAGLRFPLNSFCRSLFHRLGIGPNQLNPNGWRTIVAMQMLWHEVFEGNRPITADEFLYCYKPLEFTQSASVYQISSRGPQFSLIRGRSSSDRLWKNEFFFISGNWAGDPIDVNNAPFPPFTSALSCLCPEGMVFFLCFVCFI